MTISSTTEARGAMPELDWHERTFEIGGSIAWALLDQRGEMLMLVIQSVAGEELALDEYLEQPGELVLWTIHGTLTLVKQALRLGQRQSYHHPGGQLVVKTDLWVGICQRFTKRQPIGPPPLSVRPRRSRGPDNK